MDSSLAVITIVRVSNSFMLFAPDLLSIHAVIRYAITIRTQVERFSMITTVDAFV